MRPSCEAAPDAMPDDDSSSRYGITHKPVLLRSLLCERQVVHAKRSEARLSAAACERARAPHAGRRFGNNRMADASSTRSLLLAAAAGAALAAACTAVWLSHVAREDGETTLRRAHPSQHERTLRCAASADTHAAAGCGDGVLGAVGNTPLVRIASLSDATGCEARAHSPSHGALPAQLADGVRSQIYGKAELTNPGGSVKDRVAVRILQARHACVAAASPLL